MRAPSIFAARSFAIEDRLRKELSYQAQLHDTNIQDSRARSNGTDHEPRNGPRAAQCSNGTEIDSIIATLCGIPIAVL